MRPILETEGVSYSYEDGTSALEDVSISIEEGGKIALVGPNGAGKSTLMLMFNGILRPRAGRVLFHGEPIRYDAASLRGIRRRVGMVFQNPDDQLFAPTVYQDVAFGPANLGFPREKIERYVSHALAYVGLSGYESRPPHHLSGGEKRRVAIAGVLAMEPEVMILDEPTSNLDPASAEEIMEMLDELHLGGKTMIISTHDVDLAYRWAEAVILMVGGRVLRAGTSQEVFGDPQLIRRARLKLPSVIELYQELSGRGLLNGSRPPRSILELTDMLDDGARGRRRPGRIYICSVDDCGHEEIRGLLEGMEGCFTGAMGTSAKFMAEKHGIPLDFTYGVIDKCLLRALLGKDCLIIVSREMADHVKR
ncbi:MAG: ATP-binding cassette domain-containing protein, partial [Methanothrix sp.]|nr:ATP-binding cassette domain-containing protein [Methanothrix sp.]